MMPATRTAGALLTIALLVHNALAADYYPFRGLDDPARQLETLADQCKTDPTPELLTTVGWLLHIYRNDNRAARDFFQRAADAQPTNQWAKYGLCLIDEIEGDFDAVLSNSLALCETSPDHPLALLALLNVRSLFGQIAHFNDRVEPVLQRLLADRRSRSIQFDEICREILSAINRSKGDLDGLKRLTSDGHYITEWRVVGSFGEYPNLSFLSRWKPESDLALRPRYKLGDRILKPRRYKSEDGAFHLHWARQGVYYAETFLRSPSEQEVILRISSACSILLFLNNRHIYAKDLIRNHQPLTEYVKTRLSPGYNRLLMKCLLGSSSLSANPSYKSLRFRCVESVAVFRTTVQIFGCPYGPPSVSVTSSPGHWHPVEQVEHAHYEPPALQFFSELASDNPRDVLSLGICGILKIADGDAQAAKQFLRAALECAPAYSYFNYVLGAIVEDDPSLPTQVRQGEARARFSSAVAGAGTFPFALSRGALLDSQEERDLEAIDKLNTCVAQSPSFFSWHEALYRLYQKKNWRNEQRAQLDRILSLGVESCEPLHLAEHYYRSTKQYHKLGEVMEKLQKTHIHPQFSALYHFQLGEDAKAISEYQKLRETRPHSEDIRSTLVELYERNHRWVDAEEELKAALQIFPQNLPFWRRLAELKAHTGRTGAERRIWENILRRDPVDKSARRALKALGEKDILDEFDISSTRYIHDDKIRKEHAGVSSAIIIDQVVEEIYPNCSSRQKTHQLILLNDKNAIDRWGELDVPEGDVLELRTIKRDGTVIEPELPEESKTTFSMGGLQEGDFIEFKYITTTRANPNGAPRFLGQRFFFQNVEIPMKLSQYIVIVPADVKLKYEQLNFSRGPSVACKTGRKIYKWEARDVPAIPREPLAPAESEFLPFVRVGVNFDEDAEILQYEDHNIEMTKPTDEIAETTKRILAGVPDDVERRARAVYSFVNGEVGGGGGSAFFSRSASETLADRNGDRLSLAKAMLDSAGIKSRVLVARGELVPTSKVFPGSFNSALLEIHDDSGQYSRLLDFSNRYLPFGYVGSALQGGDAIPLEDFSSSDFGLRQTDRKLCSQVFRIPRLPPADNWERRNLNASIRPDGAIEGTQLHEYTGDQAATLRTVMLEAEQHLIREFIERTANLAFRGASLAHHKVINLSDPEKQLAIEYGFRAPNFARVVGEGLLLDGTVSALRLGGSFASLDSRQTPLRIGRELNNSFHAELQLSSGARLATPPVLLLFESDFGYYRLCLAAVDDSIRIERDFHLKAQIISPLDYAKFADFCRAVDAAERKEIRVKLAHANNAGG